MPDFTFNPEKLNKLLADERDGKLPAEVQQGLDELRSNKMVPPPLLDAQFPSEVGRVYTGFQGAPPQRPGLPAPPEPKLSFGQEMSILPAEALDVAKSAAPKIGRAAVATGKAMLDPEALAGMTAGVLTAERSTPLGMLASGAATGGVATARDLYNRATDPEAAKQPLSASIPAIGESFVSGALGDVIGRGMGAATPLRRPITPQGEAAARYFGKENMMAQQMTDSSGLNFLAQFSKHAPAGKATIEAAEQKQSDIVGSKLMKASHDISPTGAISIDPASSEFNRGMAGKKVQQDIASQLEAARKNSGFPEFLSQHGQAAETIRDVNPATGEITLSKGPTVSKLHEKRSELLARSRDAYAAGDVKGQAQALKAAEKAGQKLEKALPDQAARDEYRAIADRYKGEMQRLDNETVSNVRTGRSDDVIDTILNSKLRNYAPMDTKVGQTSSELLGRMQKALSPDAWKQLQADTIHRLGERAIDDKTGNFSAAHMKDLLDALDGPTKQRLFGNQLSAVETTLGAMEQAQKYTKSEAGRLFAAIRTGGAITTAVGGTLGAGTAAVRGDDSKAGAAMGSLIGAAGFLISPYALAKMLTSNAGRSLLVRAATSKGPIAQTTKRAITRWIGQNVTEAGREVVNSEVAAPSNEFDIPNPPNEQ